MTTQTSISPPAAKKRQHTPRKASRGPVGQSASISSGEVEHRIDPMRGMAILGSKSGKTAMMLHLKPAVYRSGNAHRITDNHANVGEMKMASFRRQLVVRVVKTENLAVLREEIVNIMQLEGDAAEADFLNAIY